VRTSNSRALSRLALLHLYRRALRLVTRVDDNDFGTAHIRHPTRYARTLRPSFAILVHSTPWVREPHQLADAKLAVLDIVAVLGGAKDSLCRHLPFSNGKDDRFPTWTLYVTRLSGLCLTRILSGAIGLTSPILAGCGR
jgi:hypothetical protein